jgi:hypothetical protein
MSNKNQTGLIGAISFAQEAMSSFLPLKTSAHGAILMLSTKLLAMSKKSYLVYRCGLDQST